MNQNARWNSEIDAILFLSLFGHSNSTCFGHICSPSSGGIFQNCCFVVCIVVLYCSMYCLCVNVYCHRVTTQLQLTNISYHIIYTTIDTCCAFYLTVCWPGWFSLHGCIEMHGKQNIKLLSYSTCTFPAL